MKEACTSNYVTPETVVSETITEVNKKKKISIKN